MNLIFTLVLYNNSLSDLEPLLESIINFSQSDKYFNNIILSVFDNSNEFISYKYFKNIESNKLEILVDGYQKNIGYGSGNNRAFSNYLKNFPSSNQDIIIITNPDIEFKVKEINKIFEYLNDTKNKSIVCLSPLIYNKQNQIQYSAKHNPSLLSLLIGRISILEKLFPLKTYIEKNQNRKHTTSKIINCTYLSGCFLIVRSNEFRLINGFDEQYFLHFEDADLTRSLSLIGDCVHFPYSSITHKWQRGSHKSIKQTKYLLISMFKYFYKWGLKVV